jgi:hypothetical protein
MTTAAASSPKISGGAFLIELAMESTWLRSRKSAASGRGKNAADVCAVFLREAMDRVEVSCRNVLGGACLDGDALRRNMLALRSLPTTIH